MSQLRTRSTTRVVFTGAESTGKTTTAAWAAAHFRAPLVPEYLRSWVDRNERLPTAADLDALAGGHLLAELAALQERPQLLIYDTDLLSIALYAKHYFGDCPAWIEQAAVARAPDLYILMGDDIPWVSDPGQRDGPNVRSQLQSAFAERLQIMGHPFEPVSGSQAVRISLVEQAIHTLLSEER